MLFKSFADLQYLCDCRDTDCPILSREKKAVVTVKLQNVFGLTETIKETSCSKITF